jgi:hypothetical protein
MLKIPLQENNYFLFFRAIGRALDNIHRQGGQFYPSRDKYLQSQTQAKRFLSRTLPYMSNLKLELKSKTEFNWTSFKSTIQYSTSFTEIMSYQTEMADLKERWSNVKEKCFVHYFTYTVKWKWHEETWISFPSHPKHYFQEEKETVREK